MSELTSLTVRNALDLLNSRQVSSMELTRAYLERIDTLEPQLHAFIMRTSEMALAQARQADELRSKKTDSIPALLGLPIAVKDILCLKGVQCTCGSAILKGFIPPYSATTVQRLLDAGVVMV
jgi:aspartyl-tRNA(Asn)/glutamyl-tRNA(Gln) amidotransferase subunit A